MYLELDLDLEYDYTPEELDPYSRIPWPEELEITSVKLNGLEIMQVLSDDEIGELLDTTLEEIHNDEG